jgi:formate/nitrite transporter FocA (FNT family)
MRQVVRYIVLAIMAGALIGAVVTAIGMITARPLLAGLQLLLWLILDAAHKGLS